MKILLTNNHLERLGGSETWVYTMAKELAKEHEVQVFTFVKGYVSDLLGDLMVDKLDEEYDLMIINHNSCLEKVKNIKGFKIFTSHGIVPELERPTEGADIYVAVSENVSEKYNIPIIIKNPIDTERFKPTSEINEKPEKILAITDVSVENAIHPSRYENNMPELINSVDIVVTIGRGALEAMSCARNVIIWDNRCYWGSRGDGYLEDLTKIKGNVAGEYMQKDLNILEEAKKYKKEQGAKNREYILKNHDVRLIAKKYIDLCHTKKDI